MYNGFEFLVSEQGTEGFLLFLNWYHAEGRHGFVERKDLIRPKPFHLQLPNLTCLIEEFFDYTHLIKKKKKLGLPTICCIAKIDSMKLAFEPA